MNAAMTINDVVTLFDPMKNLTGAGIRAGLAGSNDPSQTIGTLGAIVAKGLRDTADASLIFNTGKIIESAGGIVTHAVNVLQVNTKDKITIEKTLNQLQIELSTMIDQTVLNIKEKPVQSKIGRAAATDDEDTDRTKTNFTTLMKNVSGLTTSMVKMRSVLTPTLSVAMQGLSLETMKNILPHFMPATARVNLKIDTNIQLFLKAYPQFLNEVINIASVNLTPGMLITSADIEKIIKANPSFEPGERTVLINGLPELPDFAQDIIKSGTAALSLVELFRKEIKAWKQPDTTVEIRSENGIDHKVILKNTSLGFEIPLYIQDARVVSNLIPEDLYSLPEGIFILVRNGIAGIITPASNDSVDTLLSIDALFDSVTKKPDIKITNSGNIDISFSNGDKFYGAFGYGTTKKGDGHFDAGTSSFEPHGTDPATEAYSVLVVYSDGSTQQIAPSLSALDQLILILDQLAAGSYTIDRSSGILTIFGTMRFKPSYLIEPVTTNSEKTWFYNNDSNYDIEEIEGIAWKTGDYNGDGIEDLEMWTLVVEQVDGTPVPLDVIYKQVIYTVAQ